MTARNREPPGAPVLVEGLFSFELGGSERVGADVALECVRRGYRVLSFAFYGSDGPVRRELEAGGVECHDLNYLSRTRFIRRFTYQHALFRFLRSCKAHAIHIHHCTSLILGALPARWAGVQRIVMTEHSLMELREMPSYRRQSRRFCRYADAVTVIHPSLEGFFRSELRVPAERLHYVPNGVRLQPIDLAGRSGIRHDLGVADDEFLWMYAGRMARIKDLPTLIQAFAKARSKALKRFKLILIGDGDEREALERLCHSLNLGSAVSFLGARTNVPRLIQAADGFALSSLSEGLPMVLLEAMAAHVPCVATAVGGIPELFAGNAGLLVAPGDPMLLSGSLLELASDPIRRQQISEAGFAKVAATNDLDRVVDQYLELFGLPHRWPR